MDSRTKLTGDEAIREMLVAGVVPRMRVIAMAEAGHQGADLALRELAAECINQRVEMPTELADYVMKILLSPKTSVSDD